MKSIFPVPTIQTIQKVIIAVHFSALGGLIYFWDPIWFSLSFFMYILFFWLGHEMYYHRFLSHNSFSMPLWMQKFLATVGVYCLFGTPIGIASTHAIHHKHADTDKDPHPAHYPVQAWMWTYHAMNSKDRAIIARLSKNQWLKTIGKHYFLIYFSTIIACLIIDPRIAVYGFLVPAVYGFFTNSLVNVACHRWGYQNHKLSNNSRNNLLVNCFLFFGGSALHNNHHISPMNYKISQRWYEVDLVGCLAHIIHTFKNRNINTPLDKE